MIAAAGHDRNTPEIPLGRSLEAAPQIPNYREDDMELFWKQTFLVGLAVLVRRNFLETPKT